MTSVFYYYFIDSWAGVVLIRHVSELLVSSRFPIVSISASGSYFEKWRCKGQILTHCCCWLIQPCGKRPRSAPSGLNHSLSPKKKKKNGGFLSIGKVSGSVLHSSWSLKTTQHPTTVNFKEKEIHWPRLLSGHFKVETRSLAWVMVRGFRTRRGESGICKDVKSFGPFDSSHVVHVPACEASGSQRDVLRALKMLTEQELVGGNNTWRK